MGRLRRIQHSQQCSCLWGGGGKLCWGLPPCNASVSCASALRHAVWSCSVRMRCAHALHVLLVSGAVGVQPAPEDQGCFLCCRGGQQQIRCSASESWRGALCSYQHQGHASGRPITHKQCRAIDRGRPVDRPQRHASGRPVTHPQSHAARPSSCVHAAWGCCCGGCAKAAGPCGQRQRQWQWQRCSRQSWSQCVSATYHERQGGPGGSRHSSGRKNHGGGG